MHTQEIRDDIAEHIATVMLNRPDKLNHFTRRMRDEMIKAFGRADTDDAK